jgi:hypothetical protein
MNQPFGRMTFEGSNRCGGAVAVGREGLSAAPHDEELGRRPDYFYRD